MGPVIANGMATAEALLFGRRTWQGMAAAWPERAGDPYADQMNAIKKYVASRTLTQHDLTWNSTLLKPENAIGDVAALRAGEGGDLVEPILLGGGKRIFPEDGAARPLRLVNCATTGTGVQVCTYRPAS